MVSNNTPVGATPSPNQDIPSDAETPNAPDSAASQEFQDIMDSSSTSIDADQLAQANDTANLLHATVMKQVFAIGQQMAKDNQKAQEDWDE